MLPLNLEAPETKGFRPEELQCTVQQTQGEAAFRFLLSSLRERVEKKSKLTG